MGESNEIVVFCRQHVRTNLQKSFLDTFMVRSYLCSAYYIAVKGKITNIQAVIVLKYYMKIWKLEVFYMTAKIYRLQILQW